MSHDKFNNFYLMIFYHGLLPLRVTDELNSADPKTLYLIRKQ